MALGVHYRRLVRHGGSHKVCIPKEIRHALGLVVHDYLVMTVEDGALVMRKAAPPFDNRRMK